MNLNALPDDSKVKRELPEPKIDAQKQLLKSSSWALGQTTFRAPGVDRATPLASAVRIEQELATGSFMARPDDMADFIHRNHLKNYFANGKVNSARTQFLFGSLPRFKEYFAPDYQFPADVSTVVTPPLVEVRERLPITHQGFVQGSGLSPILFNVVFEDALVRQHLSVLFPKVQILAYADDFLLFSKEAFIDIYRSSKVLASSGLEFSKEKSRSLREAGTWVVDNFKFLGITLHPKLDLVEGTPKSGKRLMFSKADAIKRFQRRDRQL